MQDKDILNYFPEESLIQILDVGAAFIETPPYQFLIDAKRCRVMGFEPNQTECDRLNQMFSAPHRFFPYAIGDGTQRIFHQTNWGPTGSLFEPNTPLLKCFTGLAEIVTPVAQIPIKTERLDDFEAIVDVDYLKIDIQGGELAVFQNATRLLKTVTMIQTEVNFAELYKGQPLFADVDIFLRSQGFQLHRTAPISTRTFQPLQAHGEAKRYLGQALWTDAVYVRDWMRLEQISTAKLGNLCILLHGVLNSVDFVHFLMLEYDRRQGTNIAARYLTAITGGEPTST
jgi:FkbM family methyltransferase